MNPFAIRLLPLLTCIDILGLREGAETCPLRPPIYVHLAPPEMQSLIAVASLCRTTVSEPAIRPLVSLRGWVPAAAVAGAAACAGGASSRRSVWGEAAPKVSHACTHAPGAAER